MQCRQTGLQGTAGAVWRPAGAGQHSVALNRDQKATEQSEVMQLHRYELPDGDLLRQ